MYIEKRKGMHITEYKHQDFDSMIQKAKGFVTKSQFDSEPNGSESIQDRPVCLTGQICYALIDNKFVKLISVIDSSD